ncbi:MAG: peptide chain release factor N(5)-glutamine methyltransferase [Planctomycetota bacterium]|nr:MAG: peptide chain release factor N(5)-glutamine methyltransferase [Planctomycetota bacterium]
MDDSRLQHPASPAPESDWTVGRILKWTTEYLRKHGSDSPRLDAEILLAHARRCPRIRLYAEYDQPVGEAERALLRDLVRRRAASEPVAYLVGHREFFSLDFEVTPAVLIPRPETETLVMAALDALRDVREPWILDLCTGSGCVAITLAVQRPDAHVVATDLSAEALEVARRNAARHEVTERVTFLQGDLFAPLPIPGASQPTDAGAASAPVVPATFDVVVANPPYVADTDFETLPPDVRLHEPHAALLAGPDGLTVIRRIVAEGPAFVRPDGWLILEIDPGQKESVERLMQLSGFVDITTRPDTARRPRVVMGRRSG